MKDNSTPNKTLIGLMKNINPYFCIIFCNTRNEVNDTFTMIQEAGFTNSVKIHKDLSTRQRKNIFREINQNKYQYVVASDLISRGLDIDGADMVISLGLPEEDI
jgi:ATP-dependent RNA helicase CshB